MFKLKVLDRYLLKSFIKPFLATFFIILFILVMQMIWKAFDSFAGKGITAIIILKFLWYTLLVIASQAFPIGVLLSSIMCLGNLAEKYEFAAAKSAGVSLNRLIRPLVILVIFLSGINFVFLNYVYPYAMLKQINLRVNIKTKEPSLALVPGTFNTEITNFQIKFDEKHGKKGNLLKNVVIYDLSDRIGNNKIITAKKGTIVSGEGSRYMTLVLEDGHFFEHHNEANYEKRKGMPASYADFKEHTINIDISKFVDDDLDKERYTKNFNMLSLQQLQDTIVTMKKNYDDYVATKANNFSLDIEANKLYHKEKDSISMSLNPVIIKNFPIDRQIRVLKTASGKIKRKIEDTTGSTIKRFKWERKKMNLYDLEFYNRIALSLACILLFFIGAPLGSIIKKGGMGMPMVLAILIYVTYHFSNTLGRNMAEENSVSTFVGSWVATLIMVPLAIFFTIRATQDKGLGDIKSFFLRIIRKVTSILPKRKKKQKI